MAPTNDTIIHRWFEEVWNKGREAAIDEMLTPDAIGHGLSDADGKALRGPAGFKPFVQGFRSAFPDMKVTIEDTVAEGDRIVGHCTVSGTHTGDGLGFKPTGRKVLFKGVCIMRLQDGRIAEGWNYFDFLGFYQQLGALPPIGDPAALATKAAAAV